MIAKLRTVVIVVAILNVAYFGVELAWGWHLRRLTLNASGYFEDWRHVQLEAYANDWALNINANLVSIWGADVDLLADFGMGFNVEVAAGYLNGWLDGGPHWIIQPVHVMPDVAPESGATALNYSHPIGADYSFTARLENTYRSALLDLLLAPLRVLRLYRQMLGYALVNVCAGRGGDR